MKRCFFIGLADVLEDGLQERVASELERLASSEDQIEFWFYTVERPFLRMVSSQCVLLFESLLRHLSYHYGVSEFWIDARCCDTAYGAILARYAVALPFQKDTREAKVFLSLPEEATAEWDAVVEKYLPEFTSVLSISVGNPGWSDLFREVVRQCDCFITELSASEGLFIQELCAQKDAAFLFDISHHTVRNPGKQ